MLSPLWLAMSTNRRQTLEATYVAVGTTTRRRSLPPRPRAPVPMSLHQRWRERPRCRARHLTPGRPDGVVHAIVGRAACRGPRAQVVQDTRAARVHIVAPRFAGTRVPTTRTDIGPRASHGCPARTSRSWTQILRSHHRAFHSGAVLGVVKTRATLCFLRLHVRKFRNSEGAIVVLSFYPSALTQRTQCLTELRRVEGRRIDPPHAARDGLRARDDAAFE